MHIFADFEQGEDMDGNGKTTADHACVLLLNRLLHCFTHLGRRCNHYSYNQSVCQAPIFIFFNAHGFTVLYNLF